MKTFQCEICHKKLPIEFLEVHHKVPKALGGPDSEENLADLCGADHKHLHALAYVMNNRQKAHTVESLAISLFPQDVPSQKRLISFANIVARAMALKKELPKDKKEESRVVVELPVLYVELMRLAGYENLNEKNKPKGIGRQVRELVATFLIRKFPLKEEQIRSLVKKSNKK